MNSTVCPKCGHQNEKGAAVCANCAADLTVACPGCGRVNWAGADRCEECGREMDSLGHVFRPLSKSVELRREELHQRVPGLREAGERESHQRLDLLRDADRRRLQRTADATAKARVRERRIILAVGAAVAGFLVLVILAAVFLR